jgi:FAD/FMN-containing dehydrogenase
MPTIVTRRIPSSLLVGQTQRLAVYCYANPGDTDEVPWDQARQIVVDTQRNNGAVVQAAIGTAVAPPGVTLAQQEGAATIEDLIVRFWP